MQNAQFEWLKSLGEEIHWSLVKRKQIHIPIFEEVVSRDTIRIYVGVYVATVRFVEKDGFLGFVSGDKGWKAFHLGLDWIEVLDWKKIPNDPLDCFDCRILDSCSDLFG